MTAEIALWLVQDGVVNGAIYALLALALLLVFAVTRVIFVPQGEYISYAAISLALLQAGQLPGTVFVLVIGGIVAAVMEIFVAVRDNTLRRLPRVLALYIALPLLMAAIAWWAAPRQLATWMQVLIVLGLVVPLGPIVYRVAYQPLASASVLVLFIVSMAVHYAMAGLGLVFFGGEGFRAKPFADAQFTVGVLNISGQSMLVVGASIAVMVALWLFFERSLYGKALRATAVNRIGARLVGIPTEVSGSLSFMLAALIGALSGLLIAPITTIYYDTGFLIGLKGFVGGILGGMVTYPMAAAGAVVLGLLEAFASFWASALKETIVFTVIIPILIWRSLRARHVEEDEE